MPSFQSHLVRIAFRALRVKDAYRRVPPPYARMRRWNISPERVRSRFGGAFARSAVAGGSVYSYRPGTAADPRAICWFPGGAYSLGPHAQHFDALKRVCDRVGSAGILLDYPKTPEHDHRAVFEFLEAVFSRAADEPPSVFIGDSAGGGLALGWAIARRASGRPPPAHVYALSPWLDLALSDPDTEAYDSVDPFLSAPGIRVFGEWYAAGADRKDPRLSPLFASPSTVDFPITLYSGTRDLLHPAIEDFYRRFSPTNPAIRLRAFPEMMHDWAVMPIPEGRAALGEIIESIRDSR